jgi:hypothetical protein
MNKESGHLKRVLIILFYWPPSGGAGVHRWLKFVKYLRNFDWEPFSLYRKFTGKKRDTKMDFGHLVNVKTYIQKGWKERLAIWIRGIFFIPDSRLFITKTNFKLLLLMVHIILYI